VSDPVLLARATNLLAHRGPDDGACWADHHFFLGHRRLAVIDPTPAGRQPMATDDGRLVVTFNGEVYNFVELRDQLRCRGHRFDSGCDTEVLLHGYREWGTTLPERLVGMFAFAIADRFNHRLFLARDRFGEKPLLYIQDDCGISFSSELAPLAAMARERRVSIKALAGYLCLNYVPGERTLFEGVDRLPAGTWRLYGAHGIVESGRFHEHFHDSCVANPSFDDALSALEGHLDDSLRLTLRSDVPVGLFLSGGIDSSLIAASAARVGSLSHAYCLTFPDEGFSEWDNASATAQAVGLPLVRVELNASALTRFTDIVSHGDDPVADSSALAVWTLAAAAAGHTKVVLTGDGGDELFGGYLTYPATGWHSLTTSRLPLFARRILARAADTLPTTETKVSATYKLMRFARAADLSPEIAHLTWNGSWLPSQAESILLPDFRHEARTALASLIQKYPVASPPSLLDLQRVDVSEYLANDILVKADRMSMAHGVELRAPFLNPTLAAFALALPDSYKCGLSVRGKRILRALAARRYHLAIASAPKQGFSIPIHQWLRRPFVRGLIHDLLSPASLDALEILDAGIVRRIVADHLERRRSYGWELWGLMVLVAWHRMRIAAPPALPATPVRRLELSLAA
jgi:asparagine synthase (glutamine-hydrolysing)